MAERPRILALDRLLVASAGNASRQPFGLEPFIDLERNHE
jgi:hypothetical protein